MNMVIIASNIYVCNQDRQAAGLTDFEEIIGRIRPISWMDTLPAA